MTVMLMAILPCLLDETSPSLLVEDESIRIVYARGRGKW
jgi:hypothetical protein